MNIIKMNTNFLDLDLEIGEIFKDLEKLLEFVKHLSIKQRKILVMGIF